MMHSSFFIVVAAFIAINEVCSQRPGEQAARLALTDKKVGQPDFRFQAAGSGNNARNWNAAVNAGVGTKVWESKNGRASLGVGGTYQQGFVRHQGQTFRSKPDFGVGAGFKFRF